MHMKKTVLAAALIVLALFAFLLLQNPEIRNAETHGNVILCFGDSLTFGTGADSGKDYPSQLSAMIGRPVINAGVPGDTTGTALERLEEDVLSEEPGIVLITLGGNDLMRGVSREEAFANLRRIVETVQNEGALVVVGGIDVPFWGRDFGDAYEQLCSDTGSVCIPNVLRGLIGKRELMSDQIHPNSRGYARMAEKFYAAMKPYL